MIIKLNGDQDRAVLVLGHSMGGHGALTVALRNPGRFRAVSAFDTNITTLAYEGRHEAAKLGCFACHGPGGIGGHPNPGSFKGHIPPWDGDEYAELVRDDAELREWILDGHAKRLWDNPAARHFLEGQVVQMPPYRRVIAEDQFAKIAAYIAWRTPRVRTLIDDIEALLAEGSRFDPQTARRRFVLATTDYVQALLAPWRRSAHGAGRYGGSRVLRPEPALLTATAATARRPPRRP